MISLFFNRSDNKGNRSKADSSFARYSQVEGSSASSMKKMGIGDKFRAYSASSSISPNIRDEMSSVGSDISKIRKTIRDSRDQIKSSTGELSSLAKDSLKDSIKTGRFSTEERDTRAANIASSAMDGGKIDTSDYEFDDDDFGDLDIGDFQLDDDLLPSDSEEKSEIESKKIDKKNIRIFKNTNLIDNSGIKASEIVTISSTIENSVTNLIRINSSGFSSVAESISYSSSLSSSAFEPIIASLHGTLDDMQTILNNEIQESEMTSRKGTTLTDMLLGNFSLSSLTSSLASNIEFISMAPAMIISVLGQQLANPIGNISKALFKKLFKRLDTGDNIGRLNKNVADLPLIMRNYLESGKLETQGGIVGKIRDNKLIKKVMGNNTISELLLKRLFGGDFSLDGVETANTKAKSSKMYYDGESHNTLNIVIPGYLMKINEALSDDNLYYEYSTGKWRDSDYSEGQLEHNRIDYANQRNTRLRSMISTSGMDDDEVRKVVNILTKENIKDLETLEQNEDIFDNEDTFNLVKESIEKDPDRFRKYMTLTDIYSTYYSNKLASVTGSEMNVHNFDTMSNDRNDISISEREENGYDKLNDSIKRAIDKMKQQKDSQIIPESSSSKASSGESTLEKIGGTFNKFTGPESDLGGMVGKFLPTSGNVSTTTSSLSSMMGDITSSGDPFNPTVLVGAISSKIVDLFSNKGKTKTIDDDVGGFNVDKGIMERTLDSEKDELTQVNEEDTEQHGFNAMDIKDGAETIMDLFTGGGGNVAEMAANSSGIFQSIFNTISTALQGSKVFSKISGPLGKVGGFLKSKALKSSVFKKFATSGMGKKLLAMKPASLSKVMGGGGKLTSMLKAGATAVKGKMAGTTMSSALTTATGIGKSVAGFAKGALAKAASSPMGSKAVASLGKVGSKLGLKTMGKGLSKIGGKGVGKILAKLGSKAGAAIPFIGPAVFVATSLPEIVQTIKHPIQAIKHPFKTIGSFLGLTEHPGVTYEENKKIDDMSQASLSTMDEMQEERERSTIEQTELLAQDMDESYFDDDSGEELPEAQKSSILPSLDMDNPLGKLLGTTLPGKLMSKMSSDGLGMEVKASSIIPLGSGKKDKDTEGTDKRSRILNIFKKMLNVSPFGLFGLLSRSESKDFLESDMVEQTVKDPERASRGMFANTAMGSLFELAEPSSSSTNWFSKGFKEAFEILGATTGGTPSTSSSSESSSPGTTMLGKGKTQTDTTKNVALSQSTRSEGRATATVQSSSKEPTPIKSSVSSGPKISPSVSSGRSGTSSYFGTPNQAIKSSIKPTVKKDNRTPITNIMKDLDENIKKEEKKSSVVPVIKDNKVKDRSSIEPTAKDDKLEEKIRSDRNKTTLNIINQYKLDESFVERNSIMDQDFEQYLIVRDLLDVVEDIGMDVNGILEQMDNMLENLTGTTVEFEKSNEERDKSNQILNILTMEDNDIDMGKTQIDENTLIRNVIPI